MKSRVISLVRCSNEHTVITLLNDGVTISDKYKGYSVFKAYVEKFDNSALIGEFIEHSKPFRGWVKIKTDINAICDNK